MKNKDALVVILLITGIILSSCVQAPTIDASAQTAVAQTLTALVVPTETPLPANTATPDIPTPTVTSSATSTPTLIPTPEPIASGPYNFPDDINPLTGLWVEDISKLNRLPVLVKVANYPVEGRPHAGLSAADIVFEYYIGVGVNRFMALYYGQDSSKIGPMRSGRLVDPQLVTMYQGILGFMSADSRVFSRIMEVLGYRAITGSPSTCPGICDDGRNIVISVFGDSGALTTIAENRGVLNTKPNLDGMRFDPVAPEGGDNGNDVLVFYHTLNQGEWKYDTDSGKYLRWIEDGDSASNVSMIPLLDENTGQQLAFSNVIILYAYYTEFLPTLHDISVWDNTYGQRAVIFRDGKAYTATWRTTSRLSPIQFTDANGEVFALKPGNTWMVLLGTSSYEQNLEGNWTFTNYLP